MPAKVGIKSCRFVRECSSLIFVHAWMYLPYNGNHPRKKSFANFTNLDLGGNFYIMRLPES